MLEELLHHAMLIPLYSSVIPKAYQTHKIYECYFQGLVGSNKDEFPLDNIRDNDIRLVA